METVKKLFERVNNEKLDLHTRYPELLERDKKNIVYVSPFYNKHGLYRMILPSLEMKHSGLYNTIVTNIILEDYTKTIDDFNVKLIPEIIQWADYMIFQANGQDMEGFIMKIRSMNPRCRIVLDIDRNYHHLNLNNYTARKFASLDKIRNLEKNIRQVDYSTYPDFVTEEFYQKKVGPGLKTAILPNLLSPYQYEGIKTTESRPKSKDTKLKILIIGDQDDYDDLNSFRDTISQVMIRVPDSKVYVLTNTLMFENRNPLRLIDYIRVPYADMSEYYKIIWNMNPDIAIIPAKKMNFYRPYYKILELGAFGIPMVAMNEYPFNHLLTKDVHILLSGLKKKFVANVRTLVDDPEGRLEMGENCKKLIWDNYTFLNTKFLQAYLDFFK